MTNFDFLQGKKEFKDFAGSAIEAEKSLLVSPATCVILTRRSLELAVKWLYTNDEELKIPYQNNISSLIHEPTFKEIIDEELFMPMKYIIKLGNIAVHTNNIIMRDEAIIALRNLHEIIRWIDYCYGQDYKDTEFDESLLLKGEEKRVRPEELEDLYKRLSAKDKKLEEMKKENESLREERTQQRIKNTKNYDFEVDKLTESQTREKYIDLELKLAGWEMNKDCRGEVPVTGMPNESGQGFVDYVLYGNNGKALAVVEAKKTGVNPKVGSQQGKLYADCLEKQFNQRPLIFTTNGFDIYYLDDVDKQSPRKVAGIFSKDELQLIIDRRQSKIPLSTIEINDNISNRYYQKEAITNVCEAIDKKQRKMLLVMATGSGKTRTAISIVDVLTRHNYVKNILFLADRKALVKQAKRNFNTLLPNLTLCDLLDNKDNPEQSRMIFSTYPTMLNSIDDAKRKDGKKLFTPAHFDLIIVDESHRSIYKKYRDIFEYFDSMLIGLTATPKDEIDKNTYSIFELESGVPTYAYELECAVEDKYLVDYKTLEIKSKIMEEGITYDDLSEDEKEEYEDTFEEDETVGDTINNTAINEWLFNAHTIDMVLNELMEKGLKVEGGDKLGKTIIFAKNSRHAEAIVDRFNKIFKEYGPHFAKQIDYSINYVDSLIDDFSTKNKFPQIAVSVDMLDTGIDIPEVLNLVFFKKVRSKSKFWQMIGRGTRLCPDLLAVGQDKENFLILDFCNNFEFFRVNPKGMETKIGKSLTEKIFNTKLDIVRQLQDLKYQESEYKNYREELLEEIWTQVSNLNDDSFRVKMQKRYVEKYRNKDSWQNLDTLKTTELKEYISPLVTPISDDELAKRFDYLIYTVDLAYLENKNASKPIRSIIQTAEELSKLGSIPQVVEKKYIIEKVLCDEFWQSADILELEEVRLALRELLKFIERQKQKIYYTNFSDEILEVKEAGAMYNANDLKNYKKKVEHYLNSHKDELAIYKLRNNKKITEEDLKTLERIMWEELGSKEEYEKEYGDTPVNKLVRNLVGLDRGAANEAFSKFLTEERLNSAQIKYVKLIVDYVVANGYIEDKNLLMEEPFSSLGTITNLFKNNLNDVREIIQIIDEIKVNSEVIA